MSSEEHGRQSSRAHLALSNFVRRWRKAYESLSPDAREAISNLDDFAEPCQLEVFWLRNSALALHLQVWIVTHFSDQPDLTIILHGPIESNEAVDILPRLGDSPRLRRPLVDSHVSFLGVQEYRDLVQAHLIGAVREFRGLAIQKIWRADFKAGNESKSLMSGRDFAWQVNGPPTRLRAKSMVNGIMSQARSGAASRRREREQPPAKQVEQGPPRVRGHGTYLYPHVWIGERPSVPFPERLRQAAFQPPQFMALMARIPTVLHEKHAGLTFTASQDGFVTVSIEPRNEALSFLNILMALLTLGGAPALAVRDEELGEVAVDARTGDVGSSNMSLILPRMLPAYPADIPFVRSELTPVLSIEDLHSTVEVAVRSSSDRTASDLLVLFGRLYTHFQSSQYAETVLLTVSLFERAALDLKNPTKQPW